jgi:hypothetical protein
VPKLPTLFRHSYVYKKHGIQKSFIYSLVSLMQLGNIMHATSEREMHMDSPKFLPNVGESCVLQHICIKGNLFA